LPGTGEGVCYIINDLLNRELIRRNFKFQVPDAAKLMSKEERGDDTYVEVKGDDSFELQIFGHDQHQSPRNIESDDDMENMGMPEEKAKISQKFAFANSKLHSYAGY
jgi:hypothetical protein